MKLINVFGSFAGYKINWHKSELMPLSQKVNKEFLDSPPFKKVFVSFVSLGIMITRKLDKLLQANWDRRIEQLKKSIEFWNTLPMSMVGKINAVKNDGTSQFSLSIPDYSTIYSSKIF